MNYSYYFKLMLLGMLTSLNMAFADGLSQLKSFNEQVTEFSGNFSQEVKNNKGIKKTSGNFSISRPQFFKWQYQKPYEQIIVGDGKFVWMYDVDLNQVVKKNQHVAIGDSPAAILANKNALNSTYHLTNDKVVGNVEYVLAKPKKEDSGYQYIKLGFTNNQLVGMILKDSFGNESTIKFSGISNQPINKKIYQFTPPKGVDILKE